MTNGFGALALAASVGVRGSSFAQPANAANSTHKTFLVSRGTQVL